MLRRVSASLIAVCSLVLPLTAQAEVGAGAYLAGRSAKMDHDYDAAARYFTEALIADPANATLMEEAMAARIALGEVSRAVPIARSVESQGASSPLISILMITNLAEQGDFEGVFRRYEGGDTLGPLLDGLVQAWAYLGAGDVASAMATFDAVAAEDGLWNFGMYHKALALAAVGQLSASEDVLATSGLPRSLRVVTAHIEVLSQMGRNDDALVMLGTVYGENPGPVMRSLQTRLEAGETLPLSIAPTVRDGMAESFFTLAGALNGDLEDEYTLLYCRIAAHLRPNSVETALLSAELLERLNRFELAHLVYEAVPEDHPNFYRAAMGRASALQRSGEGAEATLVLEALAESHADFPVVHVGLGDQLRLDGYHSDAVAAYSQAIDLVVDPTSAHWIIHYRRAISHKRLGDWGSAEADLRRALELRPEAYQALNFLGYTMVERGENLSEALDMIERAVAVQPDAGYIVDSLGWAYFRLGRFEDAVAELERAVELMPMDPTINDHLGDALWSVGREIEARFQWRRALSLEPVDPDRTRIIEKLDIGLDLVLDAEAKKAGEDLARDER